MGIKVKVFFALFLACFFMHRAIVYSVQDINSDQNKDYVKAPDPDSLNQPIINDLKPILPIVSDGPLNEQPAADIPRADLNTGFLDDKPIGNISANIIVSEKTEKESQKRISLDLKGIDIIEFLRILSTKMGLTIVSSKSVSGRINIFLNNLTFDDALDVLLLSQDLAADKKGSIINIMTSAEYERLYGKKYYDMRKVKIVKLLYAKPSTVFGALGQLKSDIGKIIVDEATGTIILIDIPEKIEFMMDAIKDLDKIPQTEIFDLKYAKPSDIKTHLSSAITAGPGELFVDEKTSKVVVSDLPDKMSKIKKMMKAFDEPTPQVLIEAEIVQITLNKEFQRNIDWERIFREAKYHGLDFVGTFPVNPSFSPSPELDTASVKMSLGTSTDNFTTTVKFLESLGDAKVLSSPSITVINNQEAKIMVGTREAYITSTQSQADTTTITSESVQFIDVGVKLSLLPVINKDGFITIKIKPEVSRVASTITTTAGSRVPIVETSEAETIVKVKDGTMIMIAGLMKDEKREDYVGMPLISKIPILGLFFNSKARQKKKTELIVFITPHIVGGDVAVSAKDIQENISPDMVSKKMQNMIMDEKMREAQLLSDKDRLSKQDAGAYQPVSKVKNEKAAFVESRLKNLENR